MKNRREIIKEIIELFTKTEYDMDYLDILEVLNDLIRISINSIKKQE